MEKKAMFFYPQKMGEHTLHWCGDSAGEALHHSLCGSVQSTLTARHQKGIGAGLVFKLTIFGTLGWIRHSPLVIMAGTIIFSAFILRFVR